MSLEHYGVISYDIKKGLPPDTQAGIYLQSASLPGLIKYPKTNLSYYYILLLYPAAFYVSLHQSGKNGSTDHSQKSGNCNCQAAHGAFYRSQLHSLGCSYSMG